MRKLSDQLIERYSRQILIDKIGLVGQKKIINSSVAIIGCGGLGSTVAQSLTMSGVGKLLLADFDNVELSNLNRQSLFEEKDIGKNKAVTLGSSIAKINSKITIIKRPLKIDRDNIDKELKDYKLIVDCSDNFETRYLINKFCVNKRKKLVSAALQNFHIQLFAFSSQSHKNYPCYECIFPSNNIQDTGTCDQLGITAQVAAMGGIMQAMTVIKIILGFDRNIYEQMVLIDCFDYIFKKIKVSKNAKCNTCSKSLLNN